MREKETTAKIKKLTRKLPSLLSDRRRQFDSALSAPLAPISFNISLTDLTASAVKSIKRHLVNRKGKK